MSLNHEYLFSKRKPGQRNYESPETKKQVRQEIINAIKKQKIRIQLMVSSTTPEPLNAGQKIVHQNLNPSGRRFFNY